MRRFIKLLVASTYLMVGVGAIYIYNDEFVESVYAQEEENELNDIFSEDYQNDYAVITQSAWFNRIINELNNHFNLDIKADNITRYIGNTIFIYPSDELINKFVISYTDKQPLDSMPDIKLLEITVEFNELNETVYTDYLNTLPFLVNHEVNQELIKKENQSILDFLSRKIDEWNKFYTMTGEGYAGLGISEDKINEDFPNVFDIELLNSRPIILKQGETKIISDVRGIPNEQHIFPYVTIYRDLLEEVSSEKYLNLAETELPENLDYVQLLPGNSEDTTPIKTNYPTKVPFNPDNYEVIDYSNIMRNRDGLSGTKHTFYAEVLQYFEDGDNAMAMLMRNGDSDMIYQAYFTSLPENRLVEGDEVDVYGILTGLKGYETVRGNENTTPVIFIDEILIKGIDY